MTSSLAQLHLDSPTHDSLTSDSGLLLLKNEAFKILLPALHAQYNLLNTKLFQMLCILSNGMYAIAAEE